jgi:hypothetical protein
MRILFSIGALFFASCGPGSPDNKIELPPTEVMTLDIGWGVILTNYIRIRATPAADGVEITALARGAVVKILEKEKHDSGKDSSDFWYKVDDGKNRGWIYGQHIEVFHVKAEALKRAQEPK